VFASEPPVASAQIWSAAGVTGIDRIPQRPDMPQLCVPRTESVSDKAFFADHVDVQLIKTTAAGNPGWMSLQICRSQDSCDL
jgi:hypothetical protein